jgi:hypothetical protein
MRWFLLFILLLIQTHSQVKSQVFIYPFIENGKIGFKNEQDSVLIKAIYDFYEPFREQFKWTVIGIGDYERLNYNATNRQVKFTGKFGFIGSSGEEIFSPQFDMVLMVYENNAVVGRGLGHLRYDDWPEDKNISFKGKMGVIDRDGDLVVPFNFNEIKIVRDHDKAYWLALDDQGRSFLYSDSLSLTIPHNITSISDFSEGLARIQIDEKFGFIDTTGQVTIQPVYDRIKDFSGSKAFVRLDDHYFWINTSGSEINDNISIVFDEVDEFSEGYARVKVFDEYGYIRPDSSFFINPRFSEASPFFNQIASVSSIDSFGYVYTNGREDITELYKSNRIRILPGQFFNDKIPEYTKPAINWHDTVYFIEPFDTLTIEKLITFHAEAIRWAPYLYYTYPQMLPKVSAGEGTLAGRYLFNVPFLEPGGQIWEDFKNKVVLKILADEKLRSLLWKLFQPYYRSSFQSMPELHQQEYLDMISYLEDYFDNYDIEKTRDFLRYKESFFAYEHPDGSSSPYRKASAQIDRLILIYEVITPEDAMKWIRKIKKEVSKWRSEFK